MTHLDNQPSNTGDQRNLSLVTDADLILELVKRKRLQTFRADRMEDLWRVRQWRDYGNLEEVEKQVYADVSKDFGRHLLEANNGLIRKRVEHPNQNAVVYSLSAIILTEEVK